MMFGKFFLSLFAISFLFSKSYVWSLELSSNEAIYFCTRDLGDNALSTAGVEKENVRNDYIKVIPNIENKENTILRHCFMMHADKVTSKDSHDYLGSRTTLGFFYNPMLDKAVYANEDLAKQVISCTPVRTISGGEKGLFVWNGIADFYREAVLKGYDAYNHNCCTVAYESISAIGGDNSAIDPRSFNLGIGIRWKFDESGSSYGLLKSISIASDQALYMAESANPSTRSKKTNNVDSTHKEEL